jgi:hypothetical protein
MKKHGFLMIAAVACGGLLCACSSSTSDSSDSPAATTSPGSDSNTSFSDETRTVGQDLAAGKYQTTAEISNKCKLTIAGPGERDNLLDNDGEIDISSPSPGTTVYGISGGQPVFSFRDGETVTSKKCGTWQQQ